jgi:hypothetical protein
VLAVVVDVERVTYLGVTGGAMEKREDGNPGMSIPSEP